MKVHELIEDKLTEAPIMSSQKAKQEITKIAGELKIASGELIRRYSKYLTKTSDNSDRALSQLELSMNLPRGRLKGFDNLYKRMKGV